jgi:hypothetical protein
MSSNCTKPDCFHLGNTAACLCHRCCCCWCFYDEQVADTEAEQPAAVADANLVAHALSGSSSSIKRLAAVLFGFVSVDEAAQELPAEQHNSSSSKSLQVCRLRVKALHQLLQAGMIQLQVVSTHATLQQQQQDALAGDGVMAVAAAAAAEQVPLVAPEAAAAAAVYTPRPAAGAKQKRIGSKRRRSSAAAAAAATAAAAMRCSGWVQLAVLLLPEFFFEPTCSSSSSSSGATAGARVWSLQEAEAETLNPAAVAAAGDAAKAVNCLLDMLLNGSQQQQQQQRSSGSEVHDGQQTSHCEADLDDDEELQQIISQYQQQQQQQQELTVQANQCSSSLAAAAAAAAERFQPQFDLLSCPDTAAAAGSDVRQSLFDWVNPAAWQLQGQQPPGLKCKMFRYQLRALAWMKWREQHGTEPLGFSSSSSGVEAGDAAAAAAEARYILGSQLLNPLWEEMQLTVGFVDAARPTAAAGGAPGSACMCGSCGKKQQQCAIKPPPPPQQQQVVLYRAVSHGLVSRVRPAGFCGPAGGVLCDEMGLGKTVEVCAGSCSSRTLL